MHHICREPSCRNVYVGVGQKRFCSAACKIKNNKRKKEMLIEILHTWFSTAFCEIKKEYVSLAVEANFKKAQETAAILGYSYDYEKWFLTVDKKGLKCG